MIFSEFFASAIAQMYLALFLFLSYFRKFHDSHPHAKKKNVLTRPTPLLRLTADLSIVQAERNTGGNFLLFCDIAFILQMMTQLRDSWVGTSMNIPSPGRYIAPRKMTGTSDRTSSTTALTLMPSQITTPCLIKEPNKDSGKKQQQDDDVHQWGWCKGWLIKILLTDAQSVECVIWHS